MEHAVKVRMPSSWSGKLNIAAELQGISKHGLLVSIVKEWLEAKGYGTEETNTDMPRLRVAGHPWRGRSAATRTDTLRGSDAESITGVPERPEEAPEPVLQREVKSYWEEPR